MLKRLSAKELSEKCKEIFYDYMSSGSSFFFKGKEIDCVPSNPTPAHLFHNQYMVDLHSLHNVLHSYKTANTSMLDKNSKEHIKSVIEDVTSKINLLSSLNMKSQRKLHKLRGHHNFSSMVRIPLNKKVNSFYDDFLLEVLFYDDVCTPNGKFDEYKELDNKQDRRLFIINNSSILNMGLVYVKNEKHLFTISLGEITNPSQPKDFPPILYTNTFADFNKLTLEDIANIRNNDIQQFFQSKIDLDKENMLLLADKDIRGSNYKILKAHYGHGNSRPQTSLWIRYVCPSTERVYHNKLNLNYLKVSKYYVDGSYESYIDSWWNIVHLGADIEGSPVVRC